MTMESKWLLLFVLGSLIGAFAQEHPRFSANTQLVMVDVQVTEKGTGRILELLGPKDFEIYDEGQCREIREFHFETAPIDFRFPVLRQDRLRPCEGHQRLLSGRCRGIFRTAARRPCCVAPYRLQSKDRPSHDRLRESKARTERRTALSLPSGIRSPV